MDQDFVQKLMDRLVASGENEVTEFKEARKNYSTDKIGKYFSALSNEANLRGKGSGWLVFGVCDGDRKVVGTDYRADDRQLQELKQQINADTQPNVTFGRSYSWKKMIAESC